MSGYKDVKGALSGGSVITLSKGTRKGSKTGGSQDEGVPATAAADAAGEVAAGVPAEAGESAERADSADAAAAAAAAADPQAVAAARQELQLDGEKDDTLDDGDGDAADGAAAQVRQMKGFHDAQVLRRPAYSQGCI
jgi:hypothetical protein